MYLRPPERCLLCHKVHRLGPVGARAWTEVYRPSNRGPGVWFDPIHITPAPPGAAWSGAAGFSRLDDHTDSQGDWFFADGGTRFSTTNGFFGSGQVVGSWVRGWAALRFSCQVLGLEPPRRRLKGEPFVPDDGLLARAVLETNGSRYPGDELVYTFSPLRSAALAEGSRPSYAFLQPRAEAFWTRLDELHREAGKAVGE
jgi:hypothetical protein